MLDVHRAQELATQAGTTVGEKVASAAEDAVEKGVRSYRRKRRARRMERRLASVAQRLPVDTPIDRRRRSRTAGRVVWIVRLALVVAIAACAYAAWRSREQARTDADHSPAPDAFGAAVEASGDGEHEPFSTTRP